MSKFSEKVYNNSDTIIITTVLVGAVTIVVTFFRMLTSIFK